MSDAACKGQSWTFFAHECKSDCYGARAGCGKALEVRQCRAICAGCPVLAQCRFWALVTALPSGTAGGLTTRERRMVRHQLKLAGFNFDEYRR